MMAGSLNCGTNPQGLSLDPREVRSTGMGLKMHIVIQPGTFVGRVCK